MCNPKAQPWEVVTEVAALDYRLLNSLTSAPTRPLTSHYCPPAMRIMGIWRDPQSVIIRYSFLLARHQCDVWF